MRSKQLDEAYQLGRKPAKGLRDGRAIESHEWCEKSEWKRKNDSVLQQRLREE